MLYFFHMHRAVRVFSFLAVLSLVLGGGNLASGATKKSSSDVVLTSEQSELLGATVNLYCTIKLGNRKVSTTGTGVFIDKKGVILTNAHVAQYFLFASSTSKLKSDCTVRTGSPAKAQYRAAPLYISSAWLTTHVDEVLKKRPKGTGEHDFALLYVTAPVSKHGTLPSEFPSLFHNTAPSPQEGEAIMVAGYPAGGLKFKDIKSKLVALATTSTVSSIRTFGMGNPDVIVLSPSKAASSGMSGGPITEGTTLAGIVTTMSTGEKKGEGTLRGISLSYIDRAVKGESGLSIPELIAGDLAMRAKISSLTQSTDLLKALEKGLRTLR
jgi:hypothetical protein